MKSPTGRIISVTAGSPRSHALVEVNAEIQCPRCSAGKGCGAGLLGGARQSRSVAAIIGDGLDVEEGDEVLIELAPADLLRASLLVYGTPLLAGVVGAALAYAVGFGELIAVVMAMGGIFAGIVAAHLRLRNAACMRDFTPTIVERLQAGG